MLTEEQINNLKPGDPIIVQGIFSEVYADGDILMQIVKKSKDKIEPVFEFFDPYSVSLPSEHGTEVPTPKYDPTRLFREGDKVRLVERNGRKPFTFSLNYTILIVAADEDSKGLVSIHEPCSSDTFVIHYSHLELVTPIEELEPYSIDPANTNVLFKRGKKFATFEDDDEALEVCDRLNAEYRKEHGND